jgi:transcriptional regulator with XRE-family HTH domain
MQIDQTIAGLREFARCNGLKPSKFARVAGLSAGTLRRFWHDDWNPRVQTLRQLQAVTDSELKFDR